MATSKFTTLFEWDTVQCADSTEWCPLAPYQKVFVCATYQIEKKENMSSDTSAPPTSRHGRIYVFEVSDSHQLEPYQIFNLPAVLDVKWCQSYFCGKVLLGVATATGSLLIFELKGDRKLIQISEASVESTDNSKEILALSLDWSCARSSDDKSQGSQITIVVSDSHGGTNIFHLSEKLDLVLLKRWQGHDYEAWISAFNYWDTSVVYSGGDDCTLKGWDLRAGLETPTFVNRSHNAGVTSLQSNLLFENILLSGSYDEWLRIWDLRKMKNPMHSCNLSGGVWRVKWNPTTYDSVLTACMHGGFHVVDCKNVLSGTGEPLLLASYNNHESIAYGADWSHLDQECAKMLLSKETQESLSDCEKLALVSTCSFYDHKLCLSLFQF